MLTENSEQERFEFLHLLRIGGHRIISQRWIRLSITRVLAVTICLLRIVRHPLLIDHLLLKINRTINSRIRQLHGGIKVGQAGELIGDGKSKLVPPSAGSNSAAVVDHLPRIRRVRCRTVPYRTGVEGQDQREGAVAEFALVGGQKVAGQSFVRRSTKRK